MRAATAILVVLGPAALIGAGLFLFLARDGSGRGASASPPPSPVTTPETPRSRPELEEARSPVSPGAAPRPAEPPDSTETEEDLLIEDAPEVSSPPIAGAEAVLSFRVVDARTAEPVSTFEARMGQAFLRPLLDEKGRIRHDFPDGRARFPGLIEGREGEGVQLAILARGYQELRVPDLYAAPGRELDLGTLRLERVPRLTVRVLDARTGEPVPGARVTLVAAGIAPVPGSQPPSSAALDPWSARTDRDGRVLLTSRPGEQVTLSVRHAAHAALDLELDLPLSEEHEEIVRLQSSAPK